MTWPEVRLDEVLEPVSRPVTVEASNQYRLLGVRWYGEGLFLKEEKPGHDIRAKTLHEVHKEDFVYNRLFAWKGSFALARPEHDRCFVSNEFPCFRVSPDVEQKFVESYFRQPAIWDQALALSTGSTPTSRNRLKEEQFLGLTIPLPSIEEQRQIVARITALEEKAREAARLRRATLDETRALWASFARAHFGSAKDHGARPLRALVELRGGGTPPKDNPFFWEGPIPWISPKDMKAREIFDATDHISVEATEESPAKLLEPGCVLIVTRGMILAHTVPSAVLKRPAAINQDMKALIPAGQVTPEYLCTSLWALNRRLLELVERSTHDTRKLETTKLLDFSIPVPPLGEQQRMVAQLAELQARLEDVQRLQSETQKELDALMPSILAKAFAGEL